MLDRQRVTTLGITTLAAATLVAAVWLKPWKAPDNTQGCILPERHHSVDVVFAIDTTGSMGGLLDSAKHAVWGIATHIRQIDPTADLRVGLVAYRDIGDDYVTKDFPLTSDMDAVYAQLSSYVAAGGGDTPEDVDAALYDAVHKMAWRPEASKLMFVVGDAPPATRGDVPAYDISAREAAELGIRINAIRCGDAEDTAQAWKRIATLGRGEFSSIAEDGGVQVVETPFDAKIAEVSARIDHTAVIYGDGTVHAAYEAKIGAAAAAPAPEAAARATYYSIDKKPRADADVLDSLAKGDVEVDHDKLPADLAPMTKQELSKEVTRRAAVRALAAGTCPNQWHS